MAIMAFLRQILSRVIAMLAAVISSATSASAARLRN